MGKKRKKQRSNPQHLIDEVDRFLEDGIDGLSPSARRLLEEEGGNALPTAASYEPPPTEATELLEELEEETAPSSELELILLEEGLKAVIRAIEPATSATDILDLLKRNGVTHGIDKKEILKAVETVRETDQSLSDVVVAQGKPPEPPPPPRIKYRPPKGLETLSPLESIRQLIALPEREEIASGAAEQEAWAVKPGDILAVKIIRKGKEGIDVEGLPIAVPEDADAQKVDPRLLPGRGVELAPNGVDYIASAYGYAGLENSRVSVVEPLWVSPDDMEACFLKLPLIPASQKPTPDDLNALLEAFGVAFGVDEKTISNFCQTFPRQKEVLSPLASGQPVQPPKDALPIFSLDFEFRVGTFRSDGSLDFKERNIFPAVHPDDLLAECRLPVPGQPGRTVRDKELPVDAPIQVVLVAGENVRLEREEEIQRLYASAAGGAALKTEIQEPKPGSVETRKYIIHVQPVASVEEDVGYETGNIDFKGNVEVAGSVNSGFHIHATGDIVISGSMEAGSEIRADGDIVVQQGIVGRETTVQAKGSVSAKFVHDASIQAGADVLIGSYTRGAKIRAANRVQVEGLGGADNSGGIIDGRTWAVKGIASRNIGSERSTDTHLFVGLEPDQYVNLEKLRQNVRQAELMLQKLLKAIDLPALKADEIRKLVARNPAKKATVIHYVKKGNQLAQVREKFLTEQRELEEQVTEASQEARVEVADQAFSRTIIHIGNLQLVLDEDLQKVLFSADPEQPKIIWQDLK
jgi:uncharacterized protein